MHTTIFFKTEGPGRRHADRMDFTNDPMPVALTAAGPHPDHAGEPDLYGRLVGVWDVDNRYFDETDGRWHTGTVVWTFGWILDGRAVQDVMRFQLEDGSTPTGTTVRSYDPRAGAWNVVWFDPLGRVTRLTGQRSPEGILQEGTQPDGREIRWTFTKITEDSFLWQGHIRDDGDASWRLEQEMHGSRRH